MPDDNATLELLAAIAHRKKLRAQYDQAVLTEKNAEVNRSAAYKVLTAAEERVEAAIVAIEGES